MPTDDGYPTEEEINTIEKWPDTDPFGWMAFIKTCWWAADGLWTEFDGRDDFKVAHQFFYLSTGGWSGNEEIVEAMSKNRFCWMQAWQAHHRGGHWQFSLPIPQQIPNEKECTHGTEAEEGRESAGSAPESAAEGARGPGGVGGGLSRDDLRTHGR